MDQIEEYDEELEEEPYEYNMPLSGDALSPEVGRSRESEDSMEFHNERRDKSTPLSGSRRESERSWAADSHRTSQRYSQQSDVTPRFHNRVASGRLSSHGEELGGLPSIPFRDHSSPRSMNRDQSQNSLSTFMSKNNNSVTFNLEHNEHDSISEPSLPLHSTGGNLTPTSNAASSYNGRTPDGSRRSMRQMRMDGTITTLPLSPQGESNVSVASTMNSRTHSLYSPERAPEDRRKSYDNTDHDSRDASPNGSMHSMFSERYPTQHNKDHDARSSDDDGDMYDPILCCGFVLPVWLSYSIPRTPSLNRISRCLVNALPCFWCCGDASQGSSTDRAILTRLNMICLFMTLVQLIMSMWLATVLLILDDEPGALRGFSPHLWNLNGAALSIGILAFILMVTCSCTIRVVREVDLVGVIRYLWVVLWIVPFEIFFNISLYDYHNVTKVWISHW